ncbi:MAG: hypothetical protein Q9223_003749 [Gallowayella weberi]
MHSLFFSLALLFTILSLLQSTLTAPVPAPPTAGSSWPGWDGIEKLFVFGASYTSTGFQSGIQAPQPSPSNPLGNHLRGNTASNGPNFITYLTTTFNASLVQTYNFAYPGAQVDTPAIDPSKSLVGKDPAYKRDHYPNDMTAQMTNQFGDHFPPTHMGERTVDWTGDTSLWISFFGINDVLAMLHLHNMDVALDRIYDAYRANLNFAYEAGARNFLLLNTPPMEIMPKYTGRAGHGDGEVANAPEVKRIVDGYNALFPRLAAEAFASGSSAKVMVFDFHALVREMQVGLAATNTLVRQFNSHEIRNLTDSCPWYTHADGSSSWGEEDYFDERCGTGVGGYFWLNDSHPSWSVHKVLAGRIAEMLWGA